MVVFDASVSCSDVAPTVIAYELQTSMLIPVLDVYSSKVSVVLVVQ